MASLIPPVLDTDRELPTSEMARPTVVRLNRRNAALLAFIVAAACFGLRAIHDVQLYRIATHLWEEADSARKRQNFREAARRLQEYVELQPENDEARIRLILDQIESARLDQEIYRAAIEAESLLARFPDRRDLRRKTAELMIVGGRLVDALSHLDQLVEEDPDDPEPRLLLGRCYELQGATEMAIRIHRETVEAAPKFIPAWERLAKLLAQSPNRQAEVPDVLKGMLSANPGDPQAYLARARHFRDRAEFKRAWTDARTALKLKADDPNALCLLGDLAAKETGLAKSAGTDGEDEIGQALSRAIERTPREDRLFIALARLRLSAGLRDEARRVLEEGLSKAGEKADLGLCLADLLLEAGQLEEAAELARRLARGGADPVLTAFIESRLAMAKGDWVKAAEILRQLEKSLRLTDDLASQVELHLARCFSKLRHGAWRLAACRRALQFAPRSVEAKVELAEAAEDQGFIEEALGLYRATLDNDPRSAWRLARVLVLLNLRRPAEEQNWGEFDGLVQARGDPTETAAWVLMYAEGLIARGDLGRAETALEEGSSRFPDSVDLRCASASVMARTGRANRGLEIIDGAISELGLTPLLVLMKFRLFAASAEPGQELKAEQLGRQLLERARELPEGERVGVLEACAAGCQESGALGMARQLWDELAAVTPEDVTVRRRQLGITLQLEDYAAAQRRIDDLRRLEGERGIYWRLGTALRLVHLARRGQTAGLKRASELVQQIAGEVPVAPGLFQVRAEIADLQGDLNSAVELYRSAIESGARSPEIFFKTARLLSRLQRFTEVEQLLAQFTPDLNQPSTMELGRLSAEAALGRGYLESAAARAQSAVNLHANSFEDHVWLATVLDASRRVQESEAAVRKACQIAPHEPAARLALVEWLLRHERRAEAESELQDAVAAFPEPQASLASARGSALLGRVDDAAAKFASLLESAPDDPIVPFAAADFFTRSGNFPRAEPLWRKICDAGDRGDKRQLPAARRALATCLLGRGLYRHAVEALKLLQLNADEVGQSLADLKLKARLLALLPGRANRREAVMLLSRLGENAALSVEDGFLLARLLAGLGDRSLAFSEIRSLLNVQPHQPNLLSFGIEQALEPGVGDLDAAEGLLQQLVSVEPSSFRVLAFRVRLLVIQDHIEEGRALLREACGAREESTDASRNDGRWMREAALLAAGLAAQVERSGKPDEAGPFWDDAERYWRDCLSQAPRWAPDVVFFLAARGRRDDALQLAEQHVDECPPVELAGALVSAMHSQPPASPDEFRRVRVLLEDKLLKADSRNAQLVFALGNLAQVEGRCDEAERLYRRTLELAPEHVLAANNLAYSIALRGGKLSEAVERIDSAIKLVGPLPTLLDTRAVIFTRRGRPLEAITDLETVLAETKTQSAEFHLCQALLASRKWSAAQSRYRTLVSAGFGAEKLNPLERPAWEALQKEMQSR